MKEKDLLKVNGQPYDTLEEVRFFCRRIGLKYRKNYYEKWKDGYEIDEILEEQDVLVTFFDKMINYAPRASVKPNEIKKWFLDYIYFDQEKDKFVVTKQAIYHCTFTCEDAFDFLEDIYSVNHQIDEYMLSQALKRSIAEIREEIEKQMASGLIGQPEKKKKGLFGLFGLKKAN